MKIVLAFLFVGFFVAISGHALDRHAEFFSEEILLSPRLERFLSEGYTPLLVKRFKEQLDLVVLPEEIHYVNYRIGLNKAFPGYFNKLTFVRFFGLPTAITYHAVIYTDRDGLPFVEEIIPPTV